MDHWYSARRLPGLMLAALLAIVGILPAVAVADQTPVSSPGQPQEPNRKPDFLFGAPQRSIAFRGNWRFARAGSDLFDFVTRELTIDKNDFNSAGISGDVSFALTRRLDAQFGFEWNKVSMGSEYRDLVDNNFLPINQTTSLKVAHLNAGVRYALTARGYDVSRFAWVPRRIVPFVGAGAGAVYYDFGQSGDFVDFVDLSVFSDVFRSKGWAPSAHAFGGVDLRLYRGLYATIEGRYTKASAKLGRDFIDFDPIDLSGFKMSAGVNLLF
jgi:hypothetical protein